MPPTEQGASAPTETIVDPLPHRYLTSEEGIGGCIKVRPEDFLVEELPLYEPCGQGEHLYLRVQKMATSHGELISRLQRHFGVGESAIGFAGMKDKMAVTSQTVSIHLLTDPPTVDLDHERILVLGAGSAATGIADLMVPALMQTGLTEDEARVRLWFVDSRGLVVAGRGNLQEHKLPYAHEHEEADFLHALRSIRPHVLIGATGRAGTFTQEVVELMAELHPRPTLFALSNPTSHAECTAEQAYRWSRGRAIFASGSSWARA